MGAGFLRGIGDRERTVDALTLAVIVALSALPYIGHLGFYSDDWDLIAGFEAAARSGHSVIATTLPRYDVRPVQAIYLALLHGAFGLSPLGYHIINTAVIVASTVLLYLLLSGLRVSRVEAFAAALIFALMPQLSTVRVWYAAFQIPLSMLLALVAMHAQLHWEQSRRWPWVVVAVAATCLSIGAYEIFAPVIGAFAAATLLLNVRQYRRLDFGRSLAAIAVLASVVISVGLKFLTQRSAEFADPHDALQMVRVFLAPHYDWRVSYGLNAFAAMQIYFLYNLRDWSAVLVWLLTGKLGLLVTAIALATGILAWWRLRQPEDRELPGSHPGRLLLIGLAIFVLGHATFLIVNSIMFSPTGIGNRVLVGGAVGAALILVALLEFALRAAPPSFRKSLFGLLIALLAASAVGRLELIERFWAEAPELQKRVLHAAKRDLAQLPAGSTVILDGVCPYHGPAIVFENKGDISAALSMTLDRKVGGDTVSPRMFGTDSGLDSEIYGEWAHYPYGPKLFVYNPLQHLVVPLTDAVAATRYFSRAHRQPMRCPIGYVGQEVLV